MDRVLGCTAQGQQWGQEATSTLRACFPSDLIPGCLPGEASGSCHILAESPSCSRCLQEFPSHVDCSPTNHTKVQQPPDGRSRAGLSCHFHLPYKMQHQEAGNQAETGVTPSSQCSSSCLTAWSHPATLVLLDLLFLPFFCSEQLQRLVQTPQPKGGCSSWLGHSSPGTPGTHLRCL